MTLLAITGATGFVGRQILRAISAAGHDIRSFVRVGGAHRGVSSLSNVQVVEVRDIFVEPVGELTKALSGVDTLIHAAWYAEPGKYLNATANVDCLTGTLRLAQAFQLAGGRRFVGIGTCFEYDLRAGDLGLDTPLRPQTLYAACKASVYQVLAQLLPAADVEFAWCRLFYLFGEGEDSRRLVPYVRERLAAGEVAELTSGSQIRDFLNVREAGTMIAETAVGHRQGAVNICSGVPVTVRQLAERIADECGRRDLLQFGVRPDNAFDPPRVVGIREDVGR